MLVRGVVGHDVHDDAQAKLVGSREHEVEVGESAEDGVNVAVVGNVVAGVFLRRGVERRKPDGVNPEVDE